MIARILDALHLVRGVWLLDWEGIEYATWIAKKRRPKHFEWPKPTKKHCHVYPITRVGDCVLEEDGTIQNHYCRWWKYMSGPRK